MIERYPLGQAETEAGQPHGKINTRDATRNEAEQPPASPNLVESGASVGSQEAGDLHDPVRGKDNPQATEDILQTPIEPKAREEEEMFQTLFQEYGIPIKNQARFRDLFSMFRSGEESGPINAELERNGTDRDSVMNRFWRAKRETPEYTSVSAQIQELDAQLQKLLHEKVPPITDIKNPQQYEGAHNPSRKMLRALLGGGIRGWRRARFVQEASKEILEKVNEQLGSRQRDKMIEAARQGRATGGGGTAAANMILIGLAERTKHAIEPLKEAIINAYAPEKPSIDQRLKELHQKQLKMEAPSVEEREKLDEDRRRTWLEAQVGLRQRPEYREILQKIVTRLKDVLQEEESR